MAGWYVFSRRTDDELQRSFAFTRPDAGSLTQLPRIAEISPIKQPSTPFPANEKCVVEVTGRASLQLPFGPDKLQTPRARDILKTSPSPAPPGQKVFGKGAAEGSLKPIRRMPASKIPNMGLEDAVDTCPCCAHTLA
jgi:hypothetical protein